MSVNLEFKMQKPGHGAQLAMSKTMRFTLIDDCDFALTRYGSHIKYGSVPIKCV